MNRLVNLINIPLDAGGKYIWKKSKGCIIPFEYDGIVGEIEIIDLESVIKDTILICKYKDRIHKLRPAGLKNCTIGQLVLDNPVTVITYEIGLKVGRDLLFEIVSKETRVRGTKTQVGYIVKCLNCGDTRWVTLYNIKSMKACPVCSKNHGMVKVVKGINDITTTDPWMIPYFPGGEEEASKYTNQSNVKIKFICPHCHKQSERETKINSLYKSKRVGCTNCEHCSFGEDFMYNLLSQTKYKFIKETSKSILSWSENRRYDFYIPELSCIIETHGDQHYRESNYTISLKEQQEIDNYKKELALNNGIKHYFQINTSLEAFDPILKQCEDEGLFELLNIKKENLDFTGLRVDYVQDDIDKIKKLLENNPDISKSLIAKILWNSTNTKKVTKLVTIGGIKMHSTYKYVKVYKDGELFKEYNSFKQFYRESANTDFHIGMISTLEKIVKEDKLYNNNYKFEYAYGN